MKKKLFLYILFAILIIIAISFIVLLILNFQVNNRLKIIHEDYYNNACNNMNEIGKEQFFINLFNSFLHSSTTILVDSLFWSRKNPALRDFPFLIIDS